MATAKLRQLWQKEYVQTAVIILLIAVIVSGLWFGSQLVLGTPYQALSVASGSMCVLPGSYCDGWSHPFERTLHVGDLIIVQKVLPEDIHADPEDGDILVFYGGDSLIVHRAIEKITSSNGSISSFVTKGDGNSGPGPYSPTPVKDIVGKVIMRIPWAGHLALMDNTSRILIIMILVVLVIIEFAIPIFRNKNTNSQPEQNTEKTPT